jgi:hypothetical protein
MKMQDCIRECQTCAQVCLENVTHCLEKGEAHAEPRHIQLLLDCVEICQTSARFMIRGSDFHGQICGVCAEVCKDCARSCDSLGDDSDMKHCAEECRRCAASCAEMARMMA